MRKLIKQATLASALLLVGASAAQASLVIAQSATGSESILSVVNTATNASVMQDLGDFRSEVVSGNSYALSSIVTDFITAAGGLSSITFAVTGGGATGGTAAGIYLHSSANGNLDLGAGNAGADTDGPQNSTRGNVLTSRSTLITGLNNSNLGDTDTSVNGTYGPFTGGSPNYTANSAFRWGYSSGANSTTYNTLGAAVDGMGSPADLFLYLIEFDNNSTGNSNIISLGSKAQLVLNDPVNGSRLVISDTAVVPLPASVWLLGTACAGLIARRKLAKKSAA